MEMQAVMVVCCVLAVCVCVCLFRMCICTDFYACGVPQLNKLNLHHIFFYAYVFGIV